MAWFTTESRSAGVVAADREAVWKVLTDPDQLVAVTPLLHRIEADGDLWRWEMVRLPVLGVAVSPCFTEQMTFVDGERIDYTHAPPEGTTENAAAEGWYTLLDHPAGTRLAMAVAISVRLPLPRAAGPAVRTAMRGVFGVMGAGFARNLDRHLGVRSPRG